MTIPVPATERAPITPSYLPNDARGEVPDPTQGQLRVMSAIFDDVGGESGLHPTPERSRRRSKSTVRATCGRWLLPLRRPGFTAHLPEGDEFDQGILRQARTKGHRR
jgi:hypothetical protein